MITLLKQLHSIGILHGDLKPDNIMLGVYPQLSSLNQVKLVDFGLSLTYLKDMKTWQEPKTDE